MSNNAISSKSKKNWEKQKDLSCSIGSADGQEPFLEPVKLDDAKLKALEDTCKITLTDIVNVEIYKDTYQDMTAKEAIGKAIDTYFDIKIWRKIHPLRENVGAELAEFKKRVDYLLEFFRDKSASETSPRAAALERVENELYNKADFSVMMTHPIAALKRRHFFSDLLSLKAATEGARKTFKGDGRHGTITDDATNALLLGLDNIFEQAKGKKPFREQFFYLVMQMIPEDDCPIPRDKWNWDTIADRILHVKSSGVSKS